MNTSQSRTTTPKFSVPADSLYAELRKRVNNYFKENNKDSTGDYRLYLKAIILMVGYISVYIHLVLFTPAWGWAIAECILLGILTVGIGFNVMHDASHGSFSKNKKLNSVVAYSLDFLGASSFMWDTKHNVVHHAYTNIDGIDNDIDTGNLMRVAPQQKLRYMHKYQHIYFWGLYALLYMVWIFYTDYKKYFTKMLGDIPIKKLNISDHIFFWSFKAFHLFLFVILPIIMVGFLPWIIGFSIYLGFSGILLSLVFQLAHVIEETSFPEPVMPINKIEDEWALHQLKTTANFATKNKFITWYVGGLNFQVEHHLFPRISHVHYPSINPIIRATCKELGIPYLEHPTMRLAIASHISHLKEMGR